LRTFYKSNRAVVVVVAVDTEVVAAMAAVAVVAAEATEVAAAGSRL